MAALNDSLYARFNDKGFSWTLVAVFSAKLVVGLVGVVLNADLVYITCANRSIQSVCNCLLALNALFNLCYQANHVIPFFISVTGRNFISLPVCFYLQLYGIFAVHCNLGISLSIGVDRLLCVSLPTWQNKKVSIYLSTIVGLSSCYAIYILVLCFQMTLRLPNLPVLCSASDCYQYELSVTVSRNAIIFVVLNIGCYVVVWVLLFTAAVKRDAVKDIMTIKIFKSLTIIMLMEIFGCLSNWVARLFIIPRMELAALTHLYVASLLSMAANSAMATNPIVLYHFRHAANPRDPVRNARKKAVVKADEQIKAIVERYSLVSVVYRDRIQFLRRVQRHMSSQFVAVFEEDEPVVGQAENEEIVEESDDSHSFD